MSSTGRGGKRVDGDFYATPKSAAWAVLPHLRRSNRRILDPGAGEGDLLTHAVEWYGETAETLGIEIDLDRAQEARCGGYPHDVVCADALGPDPWPRADLIFANPPFSLAMEFVERALKEAGPDTEIAFLLRLAFLEGIKRERFHAEHPSDVFVLAKRPSFTGGGTDSCAYAFFCWGPGHGGKWAVLPSEKPRTVGLFAERRSA